jgi:hypothetical protein
MKRIAILAALLFLTSCDPTGSQMRHENRSMNTKALSVPTHDSPEGAIDLLLAAYQANDLETIVATKDFVLDSRLFWEGLGLPISDEQRTNSVAAFESNFRKQMTEEGIPDYRGVKHSIVRREQLQDNFVILTYDFRWPDGRKARLRLPVFSTNSQWKAVLAPGYDHL